MIQPNDVRIDNWVEYTPFTGIPEYIQINAYNICDITGETECANPNWKERYNPIIITVDILEKAGFKFGINENGTYYIDLNGIDQQLEIILSGNEFYPQLVQAPELSSEDCQIISLNSIKYVHELQNLYHVLTGNELTINL